MSLIRRSRVLPELTDTDADPFDRFLRRFGPLARWPSLAVEELGWTVPLELTETDDEYLFSAELPGVVRDDIELQVENNMLTLRANKEERREEEHRRAYVTERCYGEVTRSIMLPETVEADRIRADLRDGVLTVHLPKSTSSRGRRIDIEPAG